jgi:hypothetical protein
LINITPVQKDIEFKKDLFYTVQRLLPPEDESREQVITFESRNSQPAHLYCNLPSAGIPLLPGTSINAPFGRWGFVWGLWEHDLCDNNHT